MIIKIDDLRGPEVAALMHEHLEHMRSLSPIESVHALDLETLRKPNITFWTAWQDGQLLGSGALKELNSVHAEVKSMRTARAHLRKGVAEQILQTLISTASSRGYHRLSLETGPEPAFAAAQALYRKYGFTYCGPFEGYTPDPFSVYMTKTLPHG
jgi:putative acetyltransferase